MISGNEIKPPTQTLSELTPPSASPQQPENLPIPIGMQYIPQPIQFKGTDPVPSLPKPVVPKSLEGRSCGWEIIAPAVYRVGRAGRVTHFTEVDEHDPVSMDLPPTEAIGLYDGMLFRKVG
jgi:hypothetical protein